jgi:hypothetical protein
MALCRMYKAQAKVARSAATGTNCKLWLDTMWRDSDAAIDPISIARDGGLRDSDGLDVHALFQVLR